jgi:hypothetical protein
VRIGLNVAVGPDGAPTHAEILDEVRAAASWSRLWGP